MIHLSYLSIMMQKKAVDSRYGCRNKIWNRQDCTMHAQNHPKKGYICRNSKSTSCGTLCIATVHKIWRRGIEDGP